MGAIANGGVAGGHGGIFEACFNVNNDTMMVIVISIDILRACFMEQDARTPVSTCARNASLVHMHARSSI